MAMGSHKNETRVMVRGREKERIGKGEKEMGARKTRGKSRHARFFADVASYGRLKKIIFLISFYLSLLTFSSIGVRFFVYVFPC